MAAIDHAGASGTGPFCNTELKRIAFSNAQVAAIWDAFPVTEGHLLGVPKRHVGRWDELYFEEQSALHEGVAQARALLMTRFAPDGFNVGYNDGAAAGQTVPHVHVHVIPRRSGDMSDPRGGVRHVIPDRGNYLAVPKLGSGRPASNRDALSAAPHRQALIAGGEDLPLTHLVRHIDDAVAVDIAVSFIMESGARLLLPHLRDLLARDGRLRFITGDYLNVTDPSALRQFLDLEGRVERYVYEAGIDSFHLKSWIFHQGDGHGLAIVGSSNMSATALTRGLEWNYRACSAETDGWRHVADGFERLLRSPKLRPLTHDWIDAYSARRAQSAQPRIEVVGVTTEPPAAKPEPHAIQRQALVALEATRREGYGAGLVVLATGLGKTWLSALDSLRPEFERILFVAHRDEILNQAIDTFRVCHPSARLGRYTGSEKDAEAQIIFTSAQTLGRASHLARFAADHFDYIIIDEFHHAAARTYRQIIDHFMPKFLLGLTATPERSDGGDLLSLCQGNLVFRCDAFEGIERKLLSPFRYLGVPDEVDYANIPWRNAKFDEAELTSALATQARARNALEQFTKYRGERALGFCCSTVHADFMAAAFRDAGLRVVAVHSGPSSAPRSTSLEALRDGELDIIFAVDMFNEGVDVPTIDTVLMLPPTESTIVWMQQFGRGLRRADGKQRLNVIDYIGNHRSFLTKVRALLNVSEGDRALALALDDYRSGTLRWPPGCEVTYDLEALDLLERLLRPSATANALEAFYSDFCLRHGQRPMASEVFQAGFKPQSTGHGSWLGFVRHMDGLSPAELQVLTRRGGFLTELERTKMTRSYKMLVIKPMQQAGALPGAISIAELADGVRRLAAQNPKLAADLSVNINDRGELQRLVREEPVRAWLGGRDRPDSYFQLTEVGFGTTFVVPSSETSAFNDLVREIIDWRLIAYLARGESGTSDLDVQGTLSQMAPGAPEAELWREYMREEIAPLFGHTFSTGSWNQGFVVQGKDVFLLVTLQKDDFA